MSFLKTTAIQHLNASTPAITLTATGNVGIGTATANCALDLSGRNDGIMLPSGTSSARPSSPRSGTLRYNSDLGTAEVYSGNFWNSWAKYDGSAASFPIRNSADAASITSTGTYWFKTNSMSTATQYYVDVTNSSGPWIRIFLASTTNYNTTSFSWDSGQTYYLIRDSQYFMYSFSDGGTNLVYPWYWRFNDTSYIGTSGDGNASAFWNYPPMGHGSAGSPLITLINTTRLSDGTNYTGYLRTGISSFGSMCDDSRSSTWGQLCLKAGGTSGSGIGNGGYGDFPHYATYAYGNTDQWARSDQSYSTNVCDSTHLFTIHVKLP